MSKSTNKKKKKEILQPIVNETKKMPPRPNRKYVANMDNIIFDAYFKDGSGVDDKGVYVHPHLREVISYNILSVGPLVNNTQMKKGANIIPFNIGKITVLEMDEESFVGSIKPWDIIAITK